MNVNQQVKHYKYVFIIINAESNTSLFIIQAFAVNKNVGAR